MVIRDRQDIFSEIESLIESASSGVSSLEYELSHYPPQDIAEVFEDLDHAQRVMVLQALSMRSAAELLAETDDEIQRQLISASDVSQVSELSEIAKEMDVDDLVDFMEQADQPAQASILEAVYKDDKQKADQLRELAQYESDTAGGIMTTNYLSTQLGTTADDIIKMIRQSEDIESVHYIYAVDEHGVLCGALSIRELLFVEPSLAIDSILTEEKDLIAVQLNDDQEDVAAVIEKYNLSAVPVLDSAGVMKGIVTVDDVLDVIMEEAEEDMLLLAGAGSKVDYMKSSVWRRCLARLPWLLVTVLGGMLSMYVMAMFQTTLEAKVAVSFFIPVIMAIGGATGNQSSTILVRSIAVGDVEAKNIGRVIRGECLTGIMIGLACGGFAFVLVSLVSFSGLLDLGSGLPVIIACSMVAGISMAVIMGTLVPIICEWLGIDPAIAAGPFIASINDILGLLIYLYVSTFMWDLFN